MSKKINKNWKIINAFDKAKDYVKKLVKENEESFEKNYKETDIKRFYFNIEWKMENMFLSSFVSTELNRLLKFLESDTSLQESILQIEKMIVEHEKDLFDYKWDISGSTNPVTNITDILKKKSERIMYYHFKTILEYLKEGEK